MRLLARVSSRKISLAHAGLTVSHDARVTAAAGRPVYGGGAPAPPARRHLPSPDRDRGARSEPALLQPGRRLQVQVERQNSDRLEKINHELMMSNRPAARRDGANQGRRCVQL